MALPRTLKELHFGAGLNTKGDARAQPEQLLDIGVNVEFDDIGDLRCRFPFDSVRTSLVGGGTLSNARRLALRGSELLCFTVDSLYAWSDSLLGWVFKGTHLAVAPGEEATFATTGDQVQCDRCTLGNVEYVVWVDGANVWIGARNLATGAPLLAPTLVAAGSWPRVVALSTKVLLTYISAGGRIAGAALDPANPTAAITPSDLIALLDDGGGPPIAYPYGWYSIDKIPSADTAFLAGAPNGLTTKYIVATITAGLVVTTSTKVRTVANPGPIEVACMPNGTTATVFRCSTFQVIKADMITIAGLADGTVNTTVGTAPQQVNQIAAAYRSVQVSGHWQCEVFYGWNEGSQAVGAGFTRHTTINDASTVGTDGNLRGLVAPVSRAFDHGGRVFCWCVFGQTSGFLGDDATKIPELAVQNACYLLRDDGHIASKAIYEVASGTLATGSSAMGALPGVQSLDGNAYTVCYMARRKLVLGNSSSGYAARSPRLVTTTFDADSARRTVQFGNTSYIAGGEIRQYDGVQLTEVGFHVAPHYFNSSAGGVGNVANGTYGDEVTWRWMNGAGETERSTSAVRGISSMAAGPKQLQTGTNLALASADKRWFPLYLTKKANVAVEVWRTQVNPPAGAPLFLASGKDPAVTTGNNRFVISDPTLLLLGEFDDALDDPTLSQNEQNPENDGTLENLAPPAATIIAASDTRIFLAGIAGDPNRVWYSKQRAAGQVAAFNDGLTFDVPTGGGAITAIDVIDGALIVWRETATYLFAGAGLDNTGAGGNFRLARILSTDLGCVSAEARAYFDDGHLVKTDKGWFVLDRSLNYQYVGEGAYRYDGETVRAMTVLTGRHQIRVVTNGRVMVFDTLVKQWAESSISDGLDMLLWNGTPTYLTATGARAELATWDGYAGTDYTLTQMDIEAGWIKFGAMQSRAIVDAVQLLGELRSTCAIRVRLARDYQAVSPGVWNYHTDKTWTPFPTTVGGSLQLKQGPRYRRCESLKARYTVTAPDGTSPLGGPCVRLTSIAIPFAVEPNAYSALAAAQKQ